MTPLDLLVVLVVAISTWFLWTNRQIRQDNIRYLRSSEIIGSGRALPETRSGQTHRHLTVVPTEPQGYPDATHSQFTEQEADAAFLRAVGRMRSIPSPTRSKPAASEVVFRGSLPGASSRRREVLPYAEQVRRSIPGEIADSDLFF